MNIKDQVNLITGGCGRIGKAAAMEFAKLGSHLVIADIDKTKLEDLKNEILLNFNVDIKTVKCDITKQSEVKNLVHIPMRALIHIQNIAPGPPIEIATATPAIFPIPTVAESAVVKA